MKARTLLISLGFALAGCDLTETIYIERANGQPVLCEGDKDTSYEVAFAVTHPDNRKEVIYEERERLTVEANGGALSTNPDRVSADVLAGSIESGRVSWIQFHVYCGDSKNAILVTPKITAKDLKRVGRAYRYVVE